MVKTSKSGKGLGRGLESLFKVDSAEVEITKDDMVLDISIESLRPNPYQPRKTFSPESLEELKKSIIENGILQPIIIRKSLIKGYEIVAGERRFRAAREAGLKTVPAVVRDFDDKQMMELALLENLQRENLSPIEEAEAYNVIMDKLGYTQEEIADKMGKSRSHVANHLRLLTMPEQLQQLVSSDKVSYGHAKVLLGLKDKVEMLKIAKKVLELGLSVRQLEELIKKEKQKKPVNKEKNTPNEHVKHFVQEQTENIREKLGTKVTINLNNDKGKIEIDFMSLEDLERIIGLIKK
ncbi:MAG: ParB/RepB/Spo0J family partition protein [Bacillales bacterium]|jgi:ParB family chromosome partitioning protein|nr:ParB/RepB/Spo0J family partition protein [Bacillales bacterium]